ncbi:hypothetical protein GALMADRAFT_141574 [Galerina marginata CBS 339.88]|uniref:Uncharacterized protein n=1 Tax=Galerina marginata (strain CBS 339.88) TaxID=685588 RepID=A0A067SUJ7_GALM3|nr:hypothetical protein GALMADRAFT_141574 [Galerina marginata CBS 339.88]
MSPLLLFALPAPQLFNNAHAIRVKYMSLDPPPHSPPPDRRGWNFVPSASSSPAPLSRRVSVVIIDADVVPDRCPTTASPRSAPSPLPAHDHSPPWSTQPACVINVSPPVSPRLSPPITSAFIANCCRCLPPQPREQAVVDDDSCIDVGGGRRRATAPQETPLASPTLDASRLQTMWSSIRRPLATSPSRVSSGRFRHPSLATSADEEERASVRTHLLADNCPPRHRIRLTARLCSALSNGIELGRRFPRLVRPATSTGGECWEYRPAPLLCHVADVCPSALQCCLTFAPPLAFTRPPLPPPRTLWSLLPPPILPLTSSLISRCVASHLDLASPCLPHLHLASPSLSPHVDSRVAVTSPLTFTSPHLHLASPCLPHLHLASPCLPPHVDSRVTVTHASLSRRLSPELTSHLVLPPISCLPIRLLRCAHHLASHLASPLPIRFLQCDWVFDSDPPLSVRTTLNILAGL